MALNPHLPPLPSVRTSLLAPLCTLALSAAASAGGLEPGSFLLFPEVDNRPGESTYLTITNTNSDTISGGIDVHLVYIDAANCLETDFVLHMTARDTVTIKTSAHVPGLQRGYAYAWAVDKITHKSVDFDFLIGQELRLDGLVGADWSVQALTFQGKPGPGLDTDLDHDGRPDLNGLEYDKAPNVCYVPRFFGQWPDPVPRGGTVSELVLLQPLAPAGTNTTANFLIWNDNEEVYSAAYTFTCWKRVKLLQVSGAFAQSFLTFTNHATTEVIGAPQIESGWFQVQGGTSVSPGGVASPNPPIFGMLIECRPNTAADLPYLLRP